MSTAIGPIHPVVPAEALQQHVAIVGRTGSGKTYAAKGMVECLLDAGRRCLIWDPTSAWHGLRSSVDGKAAGFPVVVLGGEHADVPIGEDSGSAIAHLVATGTGSFIIDTSELGQGEKHRLATALFEDLYRLNTKPLHVILDEADDVAPQHPLPESRRMFGAVDRIVRRGRKRGFRVMLISQRPAVLNKNVLSQAATLIAMKLPAPQDRKALEAWIEGQADVVQGKRVIDSLPKLARGEGWIWFPEKDVLERTTFPPNRTFDSGRSPEDDDPVAEPTALAPVDLAEIRRLLSPVAEGEEIAGTVEHTDEGAIERARQEGVAAGEAAARAQARQEKLELLDRIQSSLGGYLATLLEELDYRPSQDDISRNRPKHAEIAVGAVTVDIGTRPDGKDENRFYREPPAQAPRPRERSLSPAAEQRAIESFRTKDTAKGGGAELKILKVLAQRHPAMLTEAQWATLAGMKRTGGTWGTYKSRLRVAGFLVEDGRIFGVSPAGLSAVGPLPKRPTTTADLVAMWKKAVGGAGKMLDVLVAAYPRALTRQALADALGMSAAGGTFGTYLSRLRSNGLIEVAEGRIRCSPTICEARR